MYSEVPQAEGQNEGQNNVALSPDLTALLHQDHKSLLRSLHHLKLWNYFLSFCSILCLALLAFPHKSPEFGDDVKIATPVPKMPTEIVVFNRDDIYANHSNPASEAAWAAIKPDGDGFIIVDELEKYNLRPGIDSAQGQKFDITVFHQLHCLGYIRTYLYKTQAIAQHGIKNETEREFVNNPDDHVSHCIDYIRQGLKCSADLTVEWAREEQDGARVAVDGWGVGHQCKSWDAILRYLKDNRSQKGWELDPKPSTKTAR